VSGPEGTSARIDFLCRVVAREAAHLRLTDARVFGEPFTAERAARLPEAIDDAERVEAFVARFSRLQDTLGDKFLPVLLQALGEQTGAVIDNLDRAERLGLIRSADEWLATRRLLNRMVHEYVEDPALLAEGLTQGHARVPMLLEAAAAFRAEAIRRGWARPDQP
jgi:hypothetical protein